LRPAVVQIPRRARMVGHAMWRRHRLVDRHEAQVALTKAGMVAVVLSEFLVTGEARPSRRKLDKDKDGPTYAAIAVLCFLFVLCGGGIGWCLYLECRPDIWRIRAILYVAAACDTIFELCLCARGVFEWRMAFVVLFVNTWGSLDAVLRFPLLHGFDTPFTCKQIGLLVIKAICLIVTLTSFSEHRIKFCGIMMLSLLGLPLMYLLALPIDGNAADKAGGDKGVVDVDLVVRIYRLFANPKDRREFSILCKSRARQLVATWVRRSPLASQAACRIDPQMKRMLSRSGRDV